MELARRAGSHSYEGEDNEPSSDTTLDVDNDEDGGDDALSSSPSSHLPSTMTTLVPSTESSACGFHDRCELRERFRSTKVESSSKNHCSLSIVYPGVEESI
jgi:hypothetical protein